MTSDLSRSGFAVRVGSDIINPHGPLGIAMFSERVILDGYVRYVDPGYIEPGYVASEAGVIEVGELLVDPAHLSYVNRGQSRDTSDLGMAQFGKIFPSDPGTAIAMMSSKNISLFGVHELRDKMITPPTIDSVTTVYDGSNMSTEFVN